MNFKNIVYYISGMVILTLGIALVIESDFGASPWDAFSVGLSVIIGCSVGTANCITSIILVLLIALIAREKPKLLVILVGLGIGILIDSWMYLLPAFNSFNFIIGIIGITCLSLGISLYTGLGFPVNPIDNFMVTLADRFKFTLVKSKLITDGIGLVLALAISGPIGIGTLLMYIMLPIQISYFTKLLRK